MAKKVRLLSGKRYKATVNLGFFERVASNGTIIQKFREAEFSAVIVEGDGRTRLAEGTFIGLDGEYELPSQIDPDSVQEIFMAG